MKICNSEHYKLFNYNFKNGYNKQRQTAHLKEIILALKKGRFQ